MPIRLAQLHTTSCRWSARVAREVGSGDGPNTRARTTWLASQPDRHYAPYAWRVEFSCENLLRRSPSSEFAAADAEQAGSARNETVGRWRATTYRRCGLSLHLLGYWGGGWRFVGTFAARVKIAESSTPQSIQKGLMRIAGAIVGSASGFVLLADVRRWRGRGGFTQHDGKEVPVLWARLPPVLLQDIVQRVVGAVGRNPSGLDARRHHQPGDAGGVDWARLREA